MIFATLARPQYASLGYLGGSMEGEERPVIACMSSKEKVEIRHHNMVKKGSNINKETKKVKTESIATLTIGQHPKQGNQEG